MSESPPFDPRRIEVVDDQMAEILRTKTGAGLVATGFSAGSVDQDPPLGE